MVTRMQVNFQKQRDQALEVALSSRHTVQQALDAAKHGTTKRTYTTCPVSIMDVMYGDYGNTKTLTIDTDTTPMFVAYRWYSMCNVQMRDLGPQITGSTREYVITVDTQKLHLYAMGTTDAFAFLGPSSSAWVSGDRTGIHLQSVPVDIMNMYVRRSTLDCSPRDWHITSHKDTVYTMFKGDKYAEVMGVCDNVITTNNALNVMYMGSVQTAALYRMYLSGSNVDMHVGMIIYSDPGTLARDYSTMCSGSPLKSLTIRDQVNSISSLCLKGAQDELASHESRVISGTQTDAHTRIHE